MLLAGGAAGVYLYQSTRTATEHVHHADLMPDRRSAAPAHPVTLDRGKGSTSAPVNLVLMGQDAPRSAGGRSDTVMLLHLDADRQTAYLISLPRDLYVAIPGHGKNKINAAYAEGGPQLTVRTVQDLFGITITHAAIVDFRGLIDITRELGGVTITNPYAFSSHGYFYPQGKITLSGRQAMWFVRERYALPRGDLDRTANNRRVLLAILDKGLSARTVSDPARFRAFLSELAASVTVDNGFSATQLHKLALSLRMSGSDIGQLQVPTSGFASVPGVGSVDVVDQRGLAKLSSALRRDDLGSYHD